MIEFVLSRRVDYCLGVALLQIGVRGGAGAICALFFKLATRWQQ